MVNFISKPGVFFMGVQLNDFINSYISCGMAPPHIIGASDFAIFFLYMYELPMRNTRL